MSNPPAQPDFSAGELTQLLRRVEAGDAQAELKVLPLVYGELRKLAAAKMAREAAGHTLQPTALVHEAWLRLGGDAQPAWKSRGHFFGAAAEAMRRILVESARRKLAVRHGGGQRRADIDDPELAVAAPDGDARVLAVHEALDALAAHDTRKAELVKLHYFGGLTLAEAGEVLGVSEPTAKRDWAYARAWLFREIRT
jgi:RNA polymerase sigma factor (TIGR02999 family)